MDTSISVRGSATQYKRLTKKPRKYAELRTCGRENCTVRLSSYNRGPFCYGHSELKYIRVRGKIERND